MLAYFHLPIGWLELGKRTIRETLDDNGLGLAAQLAFYFFLALFPALLFLVALISFLPVEAFMDELLARLSSFAPQEVLAIVRDQLSAIGRGDSGSLLTLGILGAIWSSSAAMNAIMYTINRAYDIQDGRPFWKTRGLAILLTIALALFIIVSFALVLAGPSIAEWLARQVGLGPAFEWSWKILQWPVVFVMVITAINIVYYFGPDAEQDWVWVTPGAVLATTLWLASSLGFKIYVGNFANYNETYGTIGGFIVLMLWFYITGLALIVGAEMNSEIEHASPYGKNPGERVFSGRTRIRREAQAAPARAESVADEPARVERNCDLDDPRMSALHPHR